MVWRDLDGTDGRTGQRMVDLLLLLILSGPRSGHQRLPVGHPRLPDWAGMERLERNGKTGEGEKSQTGSIPSRPSPKTHSTLQTRILPPGCVMIVAIWTLRPDMPLHHPLTRFRFGGPSVCSCRFRGVPEP